eukprot:TRINITY_DN5746_c0_g1_i1.p1 TRINITY_DN5746_c0_g1~~TRINITY_DN5746_c0_g1_i1.p1  ORF type:complete len:127 (-),score=34.29 TRINITY_DN5746_c0_g1_i1:42-422(-)
MIYATAVLLLLVAGGHAYPGGSPSCTSSPGHGSNRGNTQATVRNVGGNNWEVTVPQSHKGLVINSLTRGSWDSAGAGYQNKGTCVTHSSRSRKGESSFIFRARAQGKPRFSGFVVYDYSSYASIAF